MKRLVTLCITMLLAATVGAQTLPEEFIGEFMPPLGPVDVEALLVEYHSPYSIPDSTQSHVLFGQAYFVDDVASLTFTSIARRVCMGPSLCLAVNEVPIIFTSAVQWNDSYQTYIWLENHPLTPLFDIIAVSTVTGYPVATWATGMFYLDGAQWLVHPYTTYVNYTVIKRQTPVVGYMPYAQLLEGF